VSFVPIALIFPFVFWFDINLELATLGAFSYNIIFVCASLIVETSLKRNSSGWVYYARVSGQALGVKHKSGSDLRGDKTPLQIMRVKTKPTYLLQGVPRIVENPSINCSFRHICHSKNSTNPATKPRMSTLPSGRQR
jgi:hypothetical protein